jgi:glycosyltransferase involved in cell wall biosynthesis
MEDYLVSVVLIAKMNTSLSLLRALNSVLNQIYTPIRILVVDANEPNSIYSLGLQEDLEAFPKVEYLQVGQSLSFAGIQNFMVHYVEEEYVAFLSSNDEWDPVKVMLQMEQIKGDPRVVASCCNGIMIDERKQDVAISPLVIHMNQDSSCWIPDNPAKRSAQVIYKTEAVKRAGGFDEQFEYFCDADMLIRLSKGEKVLTLPVSLCECKITPDNEDYEINNFRDGQRLLYKYMEFFIRDRRMAHNFYAQMIHLAKINYLWLDYLVYLIMYFLKAPGRTTLLVFQKIGWILYFILKWIHRELSLINNELRYYKYICLIKRGKPWKGKTVRPKLMTRESEAKSVTFASVYEYNTQNPLVYVFDHKLKSIVLPEYVKVIKKSMFYGCDELVSIEIPNTVLEIESHAFQGCRNLRQVTIQEGSRLGKIGAYAFAGCSSLKTMSLPSSVVWIGTGAFAWCSSLEQLLFTYMHRGEEKSAGLFPGAIVKIARFTFVGCSSLQNVEFGVNSILETVERGAFLGCTSLKKIIMTGNVRSLGDYCFAYCRALETAAFPQIDNMKNIGECAFLYCESLVYFLFPSKIERLNVRTFYGCLSLKSVKIPMKVLAIDHQAFAKCNALSNAMILSGDVAISPTAFDKHTRIEIQQSAGKDAAS